MLATLPGCGRAAFSAEWSSTTFGGVTLSEGTVRADVAAGETSWAGLKTDSCGTLTTSSLPVGAGRTSEAAESGSESALGFVVWAPGACDRPRFVAEDGLGIVAMGDGFVTGVAGVLAAVTWGLAVELSTFGGGGDGGLTSCSSWRSTTATASVLGGAGFRARYSRYPRKAAGVSLRY